MLLGSHRCRPLSGGLASSPLTRPGFTGRAGPLPHPHPTHCVSSSPHLCLPLLPSILLLLHNRHHSAPRKFSNLQHLSRFSF